MKIGKLLPWAVSSGLVALIASPLIAGTATVNVDYTTVSRVLSPITFSDVMSGHGSYNLQVPRDPVAQAQLRRLSPVMTRINLKFATPGNTSSGLIDGAANVDPTISGDTWISTIKGMGAAPVIRIHDGLSGGDPTELTTWPSDAAAIVRYFNITTNNRVDYYIIGNEETNSTAQASEFNLIYDAMKAVDPTIKIGGPACATYSHSYIDSFLANTGGRPDFMDFHFYVDALSPTGSDATWLALTGTTNPGLGWDLSDLRSLIIADMGATRAAQVDIHVGEWNVAYLDDVHQLEHYHAVYGALAIKNMLPTGTISEFYADKDQESGGDGAAVGLIIDTPNPTIGSTTYTGATDDPLPVYHGMGMYTGEGLFPGFGSNLLAASVTSSTGLIDVSASANPSNNIVAINSSPTDSTSTIFTLNGLMSGTVAVWQKNGSNQGVVSLGTVTFSSGQFTYSLAPYTVTTFVVSPAGSTSGQTLEVENRLESSNSQANYSVIADSLASNGQWGQLAATGTGQYVEYGVNVLAAGTYDVVLGIKTNTTRGQFQTSLDGTNVGSVVDEYGAYAYTSLDLGTVTFASAGNHFMRFTVTGKNAGSSGYYLGFDYIKLTPLHLKFETETLATSSTAGVEYDVIGDSAASACYWNQLQSTATTQYVQYSVNVPAAGTYTVVLGTKTNTNRAQFQMSVDGTNVGGVIDEYGAYGYGSTTVGSVTFTSAGVHTFKFTVTGKNASSAGYVIGLDYIQL